MNDPANEWLFNEAWGVDVAVSTPRMLAAMVEEEGPISALLAAQKIDLPKLRQSVLGAAKQPLQPGSLQGLQSSGPEVSLPPNTTMS